MRLTGEENRKKERASDSVKYIEGKIKREKETQEDRGRHTERVREIERYRHKY